MCSMCHGDEPQLVRVGMSEHMEDRGKQYRVNTFGRTLVLLAPQVWRGVVRLSHAFGFGSAAIATYTRVDSIRGQRRRDEQESYWARVWSARWESRMHMRRAPRTARQ